MCRMGRALLMRRFVFLFALVTALSLTATVTSSSGAAKPGLKGHGTFGASSSFKVNAAGSSGTYSWLRSSDGAFIKGQVQCTFVEGSFAVVGGTITDSSITAVVGEHFAVFFSDQTVTSPHIDPESNPDEVLPPDFPATCPTQTPSNAPLSPLLTGTTKYPGSHGPRLRRDG